MRKAKYNISIKVNGKPSVKEIEGYIIKKDGLVFGVDHRWSKGWVITELSSGYQAGFIIPRLKDFWTEMTTERCQLIQGLVKNLPETKIVNLVDRF